MAGRRESQSVPRPDGGIGRRAGFRYQWWQHRGGSSPFLAKKVGTLGVPATLDYFFAAVTPSGKSKLPVNVAIAEPPCGYLKTSPAPLLASPQ
jgi:hypothetical protein